MEIHHTENHCLVLSDIEPFVIEVLRLIPNSADPRGDDAATLRLYPTPMANPEAEVNSEWAEYVHPDLRHLFASAVQLVEEDLQPIQGDGETDEEPGAITIDAKHFDAWLNALNQARLALTERFRFSDADLESKGPREIGTERDLALFQIHFYGLLQEVILRALSVGESFQSESDEEEDTLGEFEDPEEDTPPF